jgi:hypothetical protein
LPPLLRRWPVLGAVSWREATDLELALAWLEDRAGLDRAALTRRVAAAARPEQVREIVAAAIDGLALPAMLAPQLRQALLRPSRNEQAKDLAQRELRGLAGFATALKVRYADIEVGRDLEPEPGLADNGDLEHDLQALLEAVGAAARKAGSALAPFVDELQYVAEEQLAALIAALRRTAPRQLPVILVGAGPLQLRGQTGRATSYAERLFDFSEIGPLPEPAARIAIAKPTTATRRSRRRCSTSSCAGSWPATTGGTDPFGLADRIAAGLARIRARPRGAAPRGPRRAARGVAVRAPAC